MTFDLDIKGKLNFGDVDLVSPEKVVKDILTQLKEETDGLVIGEINPYHGHIDSYKTGLAGIAQITGKVKYDIQEDLGEQGYEYRKFDLCLTAPSLPDYRFRVLFMGHGIGGYPVKIVLEQGIADAISGPDYVYCVNSRTELETLIGRVLTSSKTISAIQELINAARIAEFEDKTESAENPQQ